MTKRRKIMIAMISVFFLFGVVSAVFIPHQKPEPSYHGRTLSSLVDGYLRFRTPLQEQQYNEAIRQIGTNAIPYLLEWIRYVEPPEQAKRRQAIQYYSGKVGLTWGVSDFKYERAYNAMMMFGILGSDAKDAIPELAAMLKDPPPSNGVRTSYPPFPIPVLRAGNSLGHIGSDAIPSLVSALTNQTQIRVLIPLYLEGMGTNGRPAVPALLSCLNDRNAALRMNVTNALLKIAPEALNRAMQKQTSSFVPKSP